MFRKAFFAALALTVVAPGVGVAPASAAVEFYDIKVRQKVKTGEKNVVKTTYTTKNRQQPPSAK